MKNKESETKLLWEIQGKIVNLSPRLVGATPRKKNESMIHAILPHRCVLNHVPSLLQMIPFAVAFAVPCHQLRMIIISNSDLCRKSTLVSIKPYWVVFVSWGPVVVERCAATDDAHPTRLPANLVTLIYRTNAR